MANSLINNIPFQDGVTNSSIRQLLSIPLAFIFDQSMIGVLDSLSYLDFITQVAATERNSFNRDLSNYLLGYSNTTPASIPGSSEFQNSIIALNDPLDLRTETKFMVFLTQDYNEEIDFIVEEMSDKYNLTPVQETELSVILKTDAARNVDITFQENIALPSFFLISKAMSSNVYNFTIEVIMNAFEDFGRTIIQRMNLVNVTQDSSMDYLQNLKKSLERRDKLKVQGMTLNALDASNDELRDKYGITNLNERYLEQLYAELEVTVNV